MERRQSGKKNVPALRKTEKREGDYVYYIPRFSSERQRVVEFSFLSQTEGWSRVEVGQVVGGAGKCQGAGDGQEEGGDEEEVHLSTLCEDRLERRAWSVRTKN